MLVLLVACTPETVDGAPDGAAEDTAPAAPREVPWSKGLPATGDAPRGFRDRRAIVHLHSPWSHDACDNGDGAPNPACLADLRDGLCTTRVDVAFVTDHPAYAASQPWPELFEARPDDRFWPSDAAPRANVIDCGDGHTVAWLPGNEDELMPVGLDRQPDADPVENDRLLNGADAEAVGAMRDAGATVFVAHSEQRDAPTLAGLRAHGLAGMEIFNLHAAFDPDIRGEYLGLDPLGWTTDMRAFTDPTATGEPDLFFLAVFVEQAVSLGIWDALLADGPMVGVAGTDAHQNVLPIDLRDGERGDSYRRMMRWFSNHLLAEGDDPGAAEAALAAGRSYVAFEVLGTPAGLDVHLEEAAGGVVELGGSGGPGDLVVTCPRLHPESPRGPDDPEIRAAVWKDGAPWRDGCGTFATEGPGVYRVTIALVPHHLAPFLGDDPAPWIRPWPWVYTNPIRVGG